MENMSENTIENKKVDSNDLMLFLLNFKISVEGKITKQTEILDEKMKEMKNYIKSLNDKADKNEHKSDDAIKRMDAILSKLESQMEKSVKLSEKRKDIRDKEKNKSDVTIQPDGSKQQTSNYEDCSVDYQTVNLEEKTSDKECHYQPTRKQNIQIQLGPKSTGRNRGKYSHAR